MRVGRRFVIGLVVVHAIASCAHAATTSDRPLLIRAEPTPDDPALLRAIAALRHAGFDGIVPPVATIEPAAYPVLPLAGKVAFRLRDRATGALDPQIYVNRSSRMYRLALEGQQVGVAMFAASLIHEIAHGTGAGDDVAYAAQAAFLRRYLATQSLRTEDRENLEYNLVHVDDLQRIEAHRRRLAQARATRHTPD